MIAPTMGATVESGTNDVAVPSESISASAFDSSAKRSRAAGSAKSPAFRSGCRSRSSARISLRSASMLSGAEILGDANEAGAGVRTLCTGTWRTLTPLSGPRVGHTPVLSSDGLLVLFGGADATGAILTTIDTFHQ